MTRKNTKYPSKQTINLAALRLHKRVPLAQLIPLALLVLVLAAAFGKFAVADRFANADEAESRAAALSAEVESTRKQLENYSDIKQQYDTYCADWLSEEELSCSGRDSMLALIERKLMTQGKVESLSISGNIIAVNLRIAQLGDTANIVAGLYEYGGVKTVDINTAQSAAENGSTVISLLITMAVEEGSEK